MSFSMPTSSSRRRRRPIAEINVTPMVDVMLVLLVIFMISAPLMTTGIPVNLPRSQAPALGQSKDPVVIVVQKTGRLFIQDQPISWDRIIAHLASLSGVTPRSQIHIQADTDLTHGKVIALLGCLRQAGYRSLALMSTPGQSIKDDQKGRRATRR